MASPSRSSLEKVLMECQPFKEGAATIVCISCFKLLAYPSGARKIKCGNCATITDGVKIRCTACSATVRVSLGAEYVKCSKCSYTFKPQARLKIKPPEWARDTSRALTLELHIRIHKSVLQAACREKPVTVAPHLPLRTSMQHWEEEFGADFHSIGFYKHDIQLDSSLSPMALHLKDGDTVEIQRVSQYNSAGHEFVIAQFGTPTNCAFCKEFIWGIYHQGRKCAKCRLPVHHRCAAKVTSQCEADRRHMFGIVNFDDSDEEDDEVVLAVVVSDKDKIAFSSCVEEAKEPECDANFMASLSKLSHFTDQEIMDIWTHYDADESGFLERAEVKTFMSDILGAGGGQWVAGDNAEAAADRMITQLDKDCDGKVSWDDFWYFYKAQQDSQFLERFAGSSLTTEQLYEVWYHYDRDDSGALEVDEVLDLIADLSVLSGATMEANKSKFDTFLSTEAKVTWEMFFRTMVPIIKAAIRSYSHGKGTSSCASNEDL